MPFELRNLTTIPLFQELQDRVFEVEIQSNNSIAKTRCLALGFFTLLAVGGGYLLIATSGGPSASAFLFYGGVASSGVAFILILAILSVWLITYRTNEVLLERGVSGAVEDRMVITAMSFQNVTIERIQGILRPISEEHFGQFTQGVIGVLGDRLRIFQAIYQDPKFAGLSIELKTAVLEKLNQEDRERVVQGLSEEAYANYAQIVVGRLRTPLFALIFNHRHFVTLQPALQRAYLEKVDERAAIECVRRIVGTSGERYRALLYHIIEAYGLQSGNSEVAGNRKAPLIALHRNWTQRYFSAENHYLVLMGLPAHQREELVKNHMTWEPLESLIEYVIGHPSPNVKIYKAIAQSLEALSILRDLEREIPPLFAQTILMEVPSVLTGVPINHAISSTLAVHIPLNQEGSTIWIKHPHLLAGRLEALEQEGEGIIRNLNNDVYNGLLSFLVNEAARLDIFPTEKRKSLYRRVAEAPQRSIVGHLSQELNWAAFNIYISNN